MNCFQSCGKPDFQETLSFYGGRWVSADLIVCLDSKIA